MDSSSPSSRPPRKRCRSPTTSVLPPTHVLRSIAPTPTDILPPRKRFRDSYSSKDSGDEHIKVDTAYVEAIADVGISEGVIAHREDGVGMGFEIASSDVREDDEEFEAKASAVDTREIVVDPLAIKVRIDRITEIETTQRQLEASQLVASEESYDGDNGNDGNGNGENGNGGNGNPNENGRGDKHVARECTYQDFMKCQPLNFKGTEGVVELIRWFEKMETVFHISNCPEKYQVKYATCTLLNSALTWWNSYKRTIGTEAAFAMLWRELMKLMTEVYCPRNEIQKMESELWNLTVKNNDLAAYTQRFQ
ncbi:reverse transcriptase domain-containing protein [Tanacetum coccineum]